MDQKKKNIQQRWSSILGNLDNDKKDWLSDYSEYQETMQNSVVNTPNDGSLSGDSSFSSIIFPVVKRVFARTLGGDYYYESEERINRRKRILKLKRILSDIEFGDIVSKEEYDDIIVEKKDLYSPGLVAVKPMSAPIGMLMYMDYKYTSDYKYSKSESIRNERRKKIERIFGDDSEEKKK